MLQACFSLNVFKLQYLFQIPLISWEKNVRELAIKTWITFINIRSRKSSTWTWLNESGVIKYSLSPFHIFIHCAVAILRFSRLCWRCSERTNEWSFREIAIGRTRGECRTSGELRDSRARSAIRVPKKLKFPSESFDSQKILSCVFNAFENNFSDEVKERLETPQNFIILCL